MNFIPKNGTRVTAAGFRGIGTVESVRVLRCMATVRWPGGLRTRVPLEDLQEAPPDASGSTTPAPAPSTSSAAATAEGGR
jgi:hypothetical protein